MKPSFAAGWIVRTAAVAAAVNVIFLAFIGSYDVHLGPLHLAAHGLFKPILYLSATVLLATLLPGPISAIVQSWSPPPLLTALLTAALYAPSMFINPTTNNEWNHQGSTSGVHSLGDLLHFFAWRQPDGHYRPITFLSLWLDQAVFGDHLWGYHVQNIALHAMNAFLVMKLGAKLGLDSGAARWAGLLFGMAAVNYEPVMWPGARFDLLAGFFTLVALLAALNYIEQSARSLTVAVPWLMLGCFALGVGSKESAYAFAPLFFFFCWKQSAIRRNFWALAATAGVAVAMIGIRLAIFGGLGGYPDVSGQAPNFAIGFRTFTSFFTRALPVPPFTVISDVPLTWFAKLAVVGFAVWAIVQVFHSAGIIRQHLMLLSAALISALPVTNLVDWIGPNAHNVRYVYLTSVWIFLVIASASRARKWLAVFALANAMGAAYNYHAFVWIDPAPRPVAQLMDLNVTALQTAREVPSSLR